MSKATPTSSSSFGSILADVLARSVGVHSAISSNVLTPMLRAATAAKYTSQVREAASTPELWGEAAKTLSVTINDQDEVSVSASGSPDEVAAAEMLEYGTPDSPPVAVMRTFSASLTEDYKSYKNGFNL